jgi:hypothetical protein
LTEQIGYLAFNGPPDIVTKVADALRTAERRLQDKQLRDDEDRLHGLRATTERALRMTDRRNWVPRKAVLKDGREINVFQFLPDDNDTAALNAERPKIEANMAESSTRLGLQHALSDPPSSTPQIVASGIRWAKAEAPTVDGQDYDNWQAEWRERAVVMAAALAARDYEGEDRPEIETWCRSILWRAAEWRTDDIGSIHGAHIYSHPAAIAALGLAALYHRTPADELLELLFRLGNRRDLAVVVALASNRLRKKSIDRRFAATDRLRQVRNPLI